MQIKDLKPKQGNVDITIDVTEIGPVREFQKFGKPGRVATANAKDESGSVKLTLWNDDINKVKAGDKIHLTNGYVNEWQGEIQLTTGRLGKMEIISSLNVDLNKQSESKIYTNIPKGQNDIDNLNVEEEDVNDIEGDEI